MILTFIAACAAAVLGISAGAAANAAPSGDKILYLELSEGEGIVAEDRSLRENHGRITARSLWNRLTGIEDEIRWVEGIENYALEFDGKTYYLTAANEYNGLAELTVSFWIWQPDSEEKAKHIVGNVRKNSKDHAGFNFLKIGEEQGSFAFRVCDGRNEQKVKTSSLRAGKWALVTGVFRGSEEMRLYIDGKLESSAETDIENTGFNNTAFRIGINRAGEGCVPGTRIDELRIWQAAMEKDEMRDLHEAQTKHSE